MPRILLTALIFCLMLLPLRAENLSPADQQAIQSTIQAQLNAFAVDDSATAYAQAAPLVKNFFPDVNTFMTMVKRGYAPVYRNTNRNFGKVFEDNIGRPTMRVVLTAEDGKRYEAIYAMEKQPDGTWKIAGCALILIPSVDA